MLTMMPFWLAALRREAARRLQKAIPLRKRPLRRLKLLAAWSHQGAIVLGRSRGRSVPAWTPDIDHRKRNSTNTLCRVTVASYWSSIYELDQIVRQSHQLVLGHRIVTPSGNLQKSHHKPFQLLAMLRGQLVFR
jgi:hypothetical protein